jgi:hypothetical protein
MAAGLSIAYLKIIFLAVLIMVIVWALVKVWLVFYQKFFSQPIVESVDDKIDYKRSTNTD